MLLLFLLLMTMMSKSSARGGEMLLMLLLSVLLVNKSTRRWKEQPDGKWARCSSRDLPHTHTRKNKHAKNKHAFSYTDKPGADDGGPDELFGPMAGVRGNGRSRRQQPSKPRSQEQSNSTRQKFGRQEVTAGQTEKWVLLLSLNRWACIYLRTDMKHWSKQAISSNYT